MTSRERLLAAISHAAVDYVPCSFMIFDALRAESHDDLDFVSRQVEMGLDPLVEIATWKTGVGPDNGDLPGPPLHFDAAVMVTDRVEDTGAGRIIHRRYDTPAGPLTAAVEWTSEWELGPRVPLFEDYFIPRARKFLLETDEDLDRLPYLLVPVNSESRARLEKMAAPKQEFARHRGLALAAAMGVGLEAASWLCGYDGMIWAAMDRPEWLDRFVEIVHDWNFSRMEVMLELGADIFIRRGWYEGTDFLSPAHFRRFVLPSLQAEVRLARAAGAKFAYINTSGTMPVLDMLMEAGVDVLIGVDPVQGKGTDMACMREQTRGRMALWGGVNGFVTVERGSAKEIEHAVQLAMRALGPEGFILSPVDNVRDTSEQTQRNVQTFIKAWKKNR